MSPHWSATINKTREIIGTCILFVPYIIILFPFLHNKITELLQKCYLHRTPRDEWNTAVDQHSPRRYLGYLLSIVFLFTPCALILYDNYYNTYLIDMIQYFVYLSIPLLLSIIRPSSHQPCGVFDIIIILFIIIPWGLSEHFDAFLPDIHFTIYSKWNNSPQISVLQICAFNLALFVFYIFRPLQHIGLTWNITHASHIQWICIRFTVSFLAFLVFMIPFAAGVDYLSSPNHIHNDNVARDGIFRFFAFFFLTVLPIEFLYRGIVQNELHSLLDYRHEARSFLHGRKESLTEILNQFDDLSPDVHANDDKLLNRKNGQRIGIVVPAASLNAPVQISPSDGIDVRSLPYYGDDDDDDTDTFVAHKVYSYNLTARDTCVCQDEWCYFARFDHWRDWVVIVISSVIYALTIINYKKK
eukprot:627610_1